MHVLILGASGFIGYPVAQEFVRGGHTVYGQTRSESKRQQFISEEITPVICAPDSKDWQRLVPNLDVIIDCLGGPDMKDIAESVLNMTVSAAQSLRPASAPKLTFIHTSGTWAHGDSRFNRAVSDTQAILNPPEILAWRPGHEQAVTKNTAVNGIIIRPSLLYGRSGSILQPWYKLASEGKPLEWPGTPGGRFALIHCDDLAILFRLVSEKAPVLGGLIMDASNDFTESVDDFFARLIEVSGGRSSFKYKKPSNPFEAALSTTSRLRPYLARAVVGWTPRKMGLIDGLETYYAAAVAA